MTGIRCRVMITHLVLIVSGILGCSSRDKPNIVFFLVDDLGWTDLGCYGSTFYETPNIDVLAQSGVRFTHAYAASPVCSPTRAAIMTGRHPVRVDITDWIPGHDPKDRKLLGPQDRHELPLSERTLAEAFKAKGYATFFAGKWHLGDEGFFPEDQGFDINVGGHHRGSPPGGYYVPYKNPKLKDGPPGEYLTDRLTSESIEFITQHQRDPFFLFLSFYTVHTPIQACRRHVEKFERKAVERQGLLRTRPEHEGITKLVQDRPDYASMVYAMDENVGRLLTHLDTLGLADNTVIVFTSDNGGLSTLKHDRAPTANVPLRAGKGWCYEGGIRVPLIIRALESTTDVVHHEPVISMDFYPTLLELAGIPPQPDQHKDGLSLVSLLEGEAQLKRDALIWYYPHYHGSTWTPGAAIRARDWKLIEFYDYEKSELYHLSEDLSEKEEVSQRYPDMEQELSNQLHHWLRSMGAKRPIPNPDYVP